MGCNPTKELHEDIKPALHSPAFVAHSPASSRVTTQDAVTPTRNTRKSPCRRWMIGKRNGRKFTTQRATKVTAGGFPVAVGCRHAIKLNHFRRQHFLAKHIRDFDG